MRRWVTAILLAGLVAAGVALADPGAAAATSPSSLRATQVLHQGERLVSANGRYAATIGTRGRLLVRTSQGRLMWYSRAAGRNTYLVVSRAGRVTIRYRGIVRWRTNTGRSGTDNVLTMRNDGVLALTSRGALVWSTVASNNCPHLSGKVFVIDLSTQTARACALHQQLRVIRVTTGAVDRGNGTPRGIWRVQAKIRDTTLYPAAGGAYPVRYWVPYDGAYGIHDSSWQQFPYGSQRYRTEGSHGCTHVPLTSMAWLFGWARVGTTVAIHS